LNELASNKVYLQGCDIQGRTVFVVLAKQQEMGRPEETKRFICYTLDNAIAAADSARNDLGQFVCLFDLSGSYMPSHLIIADIWFEETFSSCHFASIVLMLLPFVFAASANQTSVCFVYHLAHSTVFVCA